jgi:hypothetical protein
LVPGLPQYGISLVSVDTDEASLLKLKAVQIIRKRKSVETVTDSEEPQEKTKDEPDTVEKAKAREGRLVSWLQRPVAREEKSPTSLRVEEAKRESRRNIALK